MTGPPDPITSLTAADLMSTDLLVVSEGESVAAAWELMARGRIHHLPVVRGRLCVGLLDDRALFQAWSPGSLSRTRRKVGELLTRRPPVVDPDAALVELARRMEEYGTDGVVIVGPLGEALGVVTVTDLVAALAGVLA